MSRGQERERTSVHYPQPTDADDAGLGVNDGVGVPDLAHSA